MEMYNLLDEPSIYGLDDTGYIWIATNYENCGYDGNGQAVALRPDGQLDLYESLSHCSCYGPLDNTIITVSQEEYLREKDDVLDWRIGVELDAKVRELLNEPT